jgi:hypothetical protein
VYGAFTPRGGLFANLTSLGMLGFFKLIATIVAGFLALLITILVWKVRYRKPRAVSGSYEVGKINHTQLDRRPWKFRRCPTFLLLCVSLGLLCDRRQQLKCIVVL